MRTYASLLFIYSFVLLLAAIFMPQKAGARPDTSTHPLDPPQKTTRDEYVQNRSLRIRNIKLDFNDKILPEALNMLKDSNYAVSTGLDKFWPEIFIKHSIRSISRNNRSILFIFSHADFDGERMRYYINTHDAPLIKESLNDAKLPNPESIEIFKGLIWYSWKK